MAAHSRMMLRRAIAAAFVFATGACADNLIAPTSSDAALTPGALSLTKKVPLGPGARAFIDKDGTTVFEVSTTSDWDNAAVQPGQLTHVHFKLCKGWNKDGSTTKMFSANFHYKSADGVVDKEKDDEVDDVDDPAYKNDPDRVNWDRSSEWSVIKPGGSSLGFKFRGLKYNDLVEIKISYGNPTLTPTLHATICVPIQNAPSPNLGPLPGGSNALTGSLVVRAGVSTPYTGYVTDGNGTANIRGTCVFYVDGVRLAQTVPVAVNVEPGLGGTGTCTIPIVFTTGGEHVIHLQVVDVYPADYNIEDNGTDLTVYVTGMVGGGGSGGGTGNPNCSLSAVECQSVVASFSAVQTIQNTAVTTGAATITSYVDGTPTLYAPREASGNMPNQGSTVGVTFQRALAAPFTLSVSSNTDGSPLAAFTVTGSSLNPTGHGDELCTATVSVENPVGYYAKVCTYPGADKTVVTFNSHADFNYDQGQFVPFGTHLTFSADLTAGTGLHYRITRTIDLRTTTDALIAPVCVRNTGNVSATCTYYAGAATTKAGANATGTNIIVAPTDH